MTTEPITRNNSRVFSVRLPLDEAERVDALAQKSGLVRNDYIRLCLKGSSAFVDADALVEVVEALRKLEQQMDDYLGRLESLSAVAKQQRWDLAAQQQILGEIRRAERLSEALFKAQRRSIQALNAVRKKVDR